MGAYDIKKLLEKLKSRGVDVAEEAAKALVEETFDWAAEAAIASENKVDDILAGVLTMVKPRILELVDKIDGEQG